MRKNLLYSFGKIIYNFASKKVVLFVLISSVFILSLVSLTNVYTYPRFSALTGDKCIDCHVSPTGGSMRNQYGINYARQELQMDYLEKYSKKVKFNPELNKSISVGGDIRIANINDEVPNSPNMSTFLTMEGDLYVNANLNDYLNVFISPGIQIPNIPTKPQVYGMVSNLPLNIYFKAGRFSPNYGINIPEHRAFQRIDFLSTPYSSDAGFELGLTPGILTFNIALFNGLNTEFFDSDRKKMFVANADIMLSGKDNKINVDLGTSFYNNPYDIFNPLSGNKLNAVTHAYSGFTKIGIMKHVAILGEVDFKENTIASNMRRGLYGFGELSVKLVKGFELRSQYEYRDPNRDLGGDRTMRYSFGGAIFPLIGLEFEAMFRFINDDALPNTTEYQGMLHFYF
jgi:hypothetical protein